MKITTDSSFNKLIEISCISAEDIADDFAPLHKKKLLTYSEEEDYEEYEIVEIDNLPYGIVIVSDEPLKANIIFKFSKPLINKLIAKGKSWFNENLSLCHFFYWKDDYDVGHIRLTMQNELKIISSISIDEL